MTKKRKIEVLKQIKQFFGRKYPNVFKAGICLAVNKVLTERETDKHNPYVSLRFLGIAKPQTANLYWFPVNEDGHKKRIRLINKAIKKLQCK